MYDILRHLGGTGLNFKVKFFFFLFALYILITKVKLFQEITSCNLIVLLKNGKQSFLIT